MSVTPPEEKSPTEWRPDCTCQSNPDHWRHRSDCPLRYWYGQQEADERAAKALDRIRELEEALHEVCGESTEPAIVKLAERALRLAAETVAQSDRASKL